VTGSSLIAAFAFATIAMAQSAPTITVRMLTSCGFGTTTLAYQRFRRQRL
jgi:hypothetical protein